MYTLIHIYAVYTYLFENVCVCVGMCVYCVCVYVCVCMYVCV